MKKYYIILILITIFLLTNCTSYGIVSERYSLDGWGVVYGDSETIEEICKGKRGCCIPYTKTIYCPENFDYVCGHELRHITNGKFHK